METPSRRLFHVECIVPPGKTPQESLEWMQKVFDFYYPSYEARITLLSQEDESLNPAPEQTNTLPKSRKPKARK